MHKLGLGALVLWALAALPAAARDSSDGVPLPALQGDPTGSASVRSARVTLSATSVVLDLGVQAIPDLSGILLEGPTFGPVEADDPYPDRQFPELEFRLDGALQQPTQVLAAFSADRNIINMLRQAHIDPWAITHVPPLVDTTGAWQGTLSGLTFLGAIQQTPLGSVATWTASRTLRIGLKPGADQQVELRYSARPAFEPVAADQIVNAARERDYCVSAKSVRRLLHDGHLTAPLRAYQYAIPTAVDDVAPATVSFEYRSAGSRTDAIFLCGPHREPIAAAGVVRPQPAAVDEHGILRVLRIAPYAGGTTR